MKTYDVNGTPITTNLNCTVGYRVRKSIPHDAVIFFPNPVLDEGETYCRQETDVEMLTRLAQKGFSKIMFYKFTRSNDIYAICYR